MNENRYIYDSPYLKDDFENHPRELSLLLSISKTQDLNAGMVIFSAGDESTGKFYIIESGKVKVSIIKEDGSEKILGIQEKNTLFGETAALDDHPYFATATVLEKTRLRVVGRDDFYGLIEKHPDVSRLMMAAFARVVRMLVLQIEGMSFLGAEKRVAHMLYKLASEIGQKTERGTMISKKVTHEEIANLTGLSRVSVSLALNVFEESGILRKKRHMIEVFDMRRLKGIVAAPEG